ncbi:MAG TPA: CbtB-domain containing protein [Stellaceae bacterium]|nr:CbtB-domain containing protein [Stellaceae bacterium]
MSDTRVDVLRPEATTARVGGVASALVATLLGAFLVLGAGFAPIAAVHNAAHDARHAFAFPCH